MALHALTVEVVLTEINCGECGGTYAINERYRLQQYQKGGCWTCPYCKTGWGYSQDNENSKLKQKLEEQIREATRQAERAQRAEQDAAKKTKKLKRLEKRVHAGVCPCCTRTFQNLQRHMKTKHPEGIA